MLNKAKKSNQSGFTIIEVMIVLAIAGLILLVVLLAVPALQRNSRNTTMKNDANSVAAAITEYTSNNDGAIPVVINGSAPTYNFCDASPCTTTQSTAKVQASTTVNLEAATTTPTAAKYAVNSIDVVTGAQCTSSSSATLKLSTRAVAVVYSIESTGTAGVKCVGS